jgi:hypothetical protein
VSIVRGEITINERSILEVDVNPNFGLGAVAVIGSLAQVDANKSWWLKTGVSDTAWELQFDPLKNNSQELFFNVNGTPNYIEFYSSLVRTTPNRIARIDFIFSVGQDLLQDVLKLYHTDGTTIVITVTNSYFYSGVNLSYIEQVIT